jgi:hypothetical protein
VFVAKWFHFNDASFRSALNDCIEVELEWAAGLIEKLPNGKFLVPDDRKLT